MAGLTAELKKPSELNSAEREAWIAFTDANEDLASPYFRIEFAECCEEVRSDTRVLVVRKSGQVRGFLPLQLGRFGYARPLSGPLADVHGFICAPGEDVDAHAWLTAGGVPLFEFHSAIGLQAGWGDAGQLLDGSWIIDVRNGYDAFESDRTAVEPKAFRNIRSRRRKLEEWEGGHDFTLDDQRPEMLAKMIEWKREQYHRTKVFDVFSIRWTRDLMAALMRRRSDRFRGICSTLEINGEVAAVHAGMASEKRTHYWFPAYDPAFNKVSPGLLLLLEVVRDSAERGLSSVELGPGDYDFKRHLGSWQVPLFQGCVMTRSAPALLRSAANALADGFERLPVRGLSSLPRRALRKADKLAAFYAW